MCIVAHEVAHVVERGLVGLDDDVESGVEDVQVEVGDDDGDLDEFVDLDIESRHLAVDPDEPISGIGHFSILSPRVDLAVQSPSHLTGQSRLADPDRLGFDERRLRDRR